MRVVPIHAYGLPRFASLVGDLTDHHRESHIRFDLTKVNFIRPAFLALLCAHIHHLFRGDPGRGIDPVVKVDLLAPKAKNVRSYLEAMNILGAVSQQQFEQVRSDTKHLPLCPLSSSDEVELTAGIVQSLILSNLDGANEQVGTAIYVALAELFENFKRHAESESLGFVCAQYYGPTEYQDGLERNRKRAGAVEIAVADAGIGIEASLRRSSYYDRQIGLGANPCSLAARLGVTSKPEAHSGYGLWVTRRLAQLNQGSFVLASGDHWHSVTKGGSPHEGSMANRWAGTFVGLRLNLQNPLDMNTIYAEMAPLEALS